MDHALNATEISKLPCETEQQELAAFAIDPLLSTAVCLERTGMIHQEAGFSALAEQLSMVTQGIVDGDTQHIQGMLLGQSIVLDAIFTNLLRRGLESGFGGVKEPLLRLALQAQKQSRQTLSVLADISQPKASVLIQNNHALNQQVNNGYPNKLLNMKTDDG